MVRETRYLWVGNLPEDITDTRVSEYFQRYGKIQYVHLAPRQGADKPSCVVAFMDIKSASRAVGSENVIDGQRVDTQYHEQQAAASSLGRPPAPSATTAEAMVAGPGGGSGIGEVARATNPSPGGLATKPASSSSKTEGSRDSSARSPSQHHDRRSLGPGRDRGRARVRGEGGSPVEGGSRHNSRDGRGSSPTAKTRSRSLSSSSADSRSPGSRESGRTRKSVVGVVRAGTPTASSTVPSTGPPPTGHSSSSQVKAVLIRGLPGRSSDGNLRDGVFHEFKKYGRIASVSVSMKNGERQAIVVYRNVEDSAKARDEAHGKTFFGQKISVDFYDGPVEELENTTSYQRHPNKCDVDEYHLRASRTLFIGALEKDVTDDDLFKIFTKFGRILYIEVKKQVGLPSFAFVQFDNIRSTVAAWQAMENETINGQKIKLGFGKSLATNCVWLEGVEKTMSRKFLVGQLSRYGQVLWCDIDRETHRAIVYMESQDVAAVTIASLKERAVAGVTLQVDFASPQCQVAFIENMMLSGQLRGEHEVERRLQYAQLDERHEVWINRHFSGRNRNYGGGEQGQHNWQNKGRGNYGNRDDGRRDRYNANAYSRSEASYDDNSNDRGRSEANYDRRNTWSDVPDRRGGGDFTYDDSRTSPSRSRQMDDGDKYAKKYRDGSGSRTRRSDDGAGGGSGGSKWDYGYDSRSSDLNYSADDSRMGSSRRRPRMLSPTHSERGASSRYDADPSWSSERHTKDPARDDILSAVSSPPPSMRVGDFDADRSRGSFGRHNKDYWSDKDYDDSDNSRQTSADRAAAVGSTDDIKLPLTRAVSSDREFPSRASFSAGHKQPSLTGDEQQQQLEGRGSAESRKRSVDEAHPSSGGSAGEANAGRRSSMDKQKLSVIGSRLPEDLLNLMRNASGSGLKAAVDLLRPQMMGRGGDADGEEKDSASSDRSHSVSPSPKEGDVEDVSHLEQQKAKILAMLDQLKDNDDEDDGPAARKPRLEDVFDLERSPSLSMKRWRDTFKGIGFPDDKKDDAPSTNLATIALAKSLKASVMRHMAAAAAAVPAADESGKFKPIDSTLSLRKQMEERRKEEQSMSVSHDRPVTGNNRVGESEELPDSSTLGDSEEGGVSGLNEKSPTKEASASFVPKRRKMDLKKCEPRVYRRQHALEFFDDAANKGNSEGEGGGSDDEIEGAERVVTADERLRAMDVGTVSTPGSASAVSDTSVFLTPLTATEQFIIPPETNSTSADGEGSNSAKSSAKDSHGSSSDGGNVPNIPLECKCGADALRDCRTRREALTRPMSLPLPRFARHFGFQRSGSAASKSRRHSSDTQQSHANSPKLSPFVSQHSSPRQPLAAPLSSPKALSDDALTAPRTGVDSTEMAAVSGDAEEASVKLAPAVPANNRMSIDSVSSESTQATEEPATATAKSEAMAVDTDEQTTKDAVRSEQIVKVKSEAEVTNVGDSAAVTPVVKAEPAETAKESTVAAKGRDKKRSLTSDSDISSDDEGLSKLPDIDVDARIAALDKRCEVLETLRGGKMAATGGGAVLLPVELAPLHSEVSTVAAVDTSVTPGPVMDYRERYRVKKKTDAFGISAAADVLGSATLAESKVESANIVKSILSKKSVFDHDASRLHRVSELSATDGGSSQSSSVYSSLLGRQSSTSDYLQSATSNIYPAGMSPSLPASIYTSVAGGNSFTYGQSQSTSAMQGVSYSDYSNWNGGNLSASGSWLSGGQHALTEGSSLSSSSHFLVQRPSQDNSTNNSATLKLNSPTAFPAAAAQPMGATPLQAVDNSAETGGAASATASRDPRRKLVPTTPPIGAAPTSLAWQKSDDKSQSGFPDAPSTPSVTVTSPAPWSSTTKSSSTPVATESVSPLGKFTTANTSTAAAVTDVDAVKTVATSQMSPSATASGDNTSVVSPVASNVSAVDRKPLFVSIPPATSTEVLPPGGESLLSQQSVSVKVEAIDVDEVRGEKRKLTATPTASTSEAKKLKIEPDARSSPSHESQKKHSDSNASSFSKSSEEKAKSDKRTTDVTVTPKPPKTASSVQPSNSNKDSSEKTVVGSGDKKPASEGLEKKVSDGSGTLKKASDQLQAEHKLGVEEATVPATVKSEAVPATPVVAAKPIQSILKSSSSATPASSSSDKNRSDSSKSSTKPDANKTSSGKHVSSSSKPRSDSSSKPKESATVSGSKDANKTAAHKDDASKLFSTSRDVTTVKQKEDGSKTVSSSNKDHSSKSVSKDGKMVDKKTPSGSVESLAKEKESAVRSDSLSKPIKSSSDADRSVAKTGSGDSGANKDHSKPVSTDVKTLQGSGEVRTSSVSSRPDEKKHSSSQPSVKKETTSADGSKISSSSSAKPVSGERKVEHSSSSSAASKAGSSGEKRPNDSKDRPAENKDKKDGHSAGSSSSSKPQSNTSTSGSSSVANKPKPVDGSSSHKPSSGSTGSSTNATKPASSSSSGVMKDAKDRVKDGSSKTSSSLSGGQKSRPDSKSERDASTSIKPKSSDGSSTQDRVKSSSNMSSSHKDRSGSGSSFKKTSSSSSLMKSTLSSSSSKLSSGDKQKKKVKSNGRPVSSGRVSREVLQLIQEGGFDGGPGDDAKLSGFTSMYDMVKRRSSMDKKKEEERRLEELSRTLTKLKNSRVKKAKDGDSSNTASRKTSSDAAESKSRRRLGDDTDTDSYSSSDDDEDNESTDGSTGGLRAAPKKSAARSTHLINKLSCSDSDDTVPGTGSSKRTPAKTPKKSGGNIRQSMVTSSDSDSEAEKVVHAAAMANASSARPLITPAELARKTSTPSVVKKSPVPGRSETAEKKSSNSSSSKVDSVKTVAEKKVTPAKVTEVRKSLLGFQGTSSSASSSSSSSDTDSESTDTEKKRDVKRMAPSKADNSSSKAAALASNRMRDDNDSRGETTGVDSDSDDDRPSKQQRTAKSTPVKELDVEMRPAKRDRADTHDSDISGSLFASLERERDSKPKVVSPDKTSKFTLPKAEDRDEDDVVVAAPVTEKVEKVSPRLSSDSMKAKDHLLSPRESGHKVSDITRGITETEKAVAAITVEPPLLSGYQKPVESFDTPSASPAASGSAQQQVSAGKEGHGRKTDVANQGTEESGEADQAVTDLLNSLKAEGVSEMSPVEYGLGQYSVSLDNERGADDGVGRTGVDKPLDDVVGANEEIVSSDTPAVTTKTKGQKKARKKSQCLPADQPPMMMGEMALAQPPPGMHMPPFFPLPDGTMPPLEWNAELFAKMTGIPQMDMETFAKIMAEAAASTNKLMGLPSDHSQRTPKKKNKAKKEESTLKADAAPGDAGIGTSEADSNKTGQLTTKPVRSPRRPSTGLKSNDFPSYVNGKAVSDVGFQDTAEFTAAVSAGTLMNRPATGDDQPPKQKKIKRPKQKKTDNGEMTSVGGGVYEWHDEDEEPVGAIKPLRITAQSRKRTHSDGNDQLLPGEAETKMSRDDYHGDQQLRASLGESEVSDGTTRDDGESKSVEKHHLPLKLELKREAAKRDAEMKQRLETKQPLSVNTELAGTSGGNTSQHFSNLDHIIDEVSKGNFEDVTDDRAGSSRRRNSRARSHGDQAAAGRSGMPMVSPGGSYLMSPPVTSPHLMSGMSPGDSRTSRIDSIGHESDARPNPMMDMGISPGHTVGQPYCFGQPDSGNFSQATIERVPNMDQLKPQPVSHGADVRSARSPAAAHVDMGGRSGDQPSTVTSSPLLAPAHLLANMQATPFQQMFPRPPGVGVGGATQVSEIKAALAQPSKLAQQELLQQQQRTSVVTATPPAQVLRAMPPSVVALPTAGGRMPFDPRTGVLMALPDGKPLHELQSPGYQRFELAPTSEPRHASSAPHLFLPQDLGLAGPLIPIHVGLPFPISMAGMDARLRMPGMHQMPMMMEHQELAAAGGRPPSRQRTPRADQSSPKASSVATASYPSPAIPASSEAMHFAAQHKPHPGKEFIPADATPLSKLLEKYPVVWQGLLTLKNEMCAVQMQFVGGNRSHLPHVLPAQASVGTAPQLKIMQRMRMEQAQLEGVTRRMQHEEDYSVLLALPCGRDHADIIQQSEMLKHSFIVYLQQKQAAGIVNVPCAGSLQTAYVVHIFPPCEFATENLSLLAPDLLQSVSEMSYMLIVVATV